MKAHLMYLKKSLQHCSVATVWTTLFACKDLHFCGGEEKNPDKSNWNCLRIASQWIADIKARTQVNWDIQGRIELAKRYALGSARDYLLVCVGKCDQYWDLNWEQLKPCFLGIYPVLHPYEILERDFYLAMQKKWEKTHDFYIRINEIVEKLSN